MPRREVLDSIQRINHDGYGFVSTRHELRTMHYDVLLRHLAKVGIDEECLIHMRFATHGSKCRANCHPFSKNGVFFAHNGVLPIPSVDDKTDSEIVFREDIYPAIERCGFGSVEADNVINSIIGGSRFALMYKGETRLYGNFSKIGNVYYSNLNWLYYHHG